MLNFQIRGKVLDPTARSTKLNRLKSFTRYTICVLGLGDWPATGPAPDARIASRSENDSSFHMQHEEIFNESILSQMIDSPTSKCTYVSTLELPGGLINESIMPSNSMGFASVLTRRLGLIVGSCMGFVVFIIMVSVLGYMKIKKQREVAKRDQPLPPEYISYWFRWTFFVYIWFWTVKESRVVQVIFSELNRCWGKGWGQFFDNMAQVLICEWALVIKGWISISIGMHIRKTRIVTYINCQCYKNIHIYEKLNDLRYLQNYVVLVIIGNCE